MKLKFPPSWGPRGSRALRDDDVPAFNSIYSDRRVAKLANQYDIPADKIAEFRSALNSAHSGYFIGLTLLYSGFGKDLAAARRDVRALRAGLERIVKSMRVPGISTRLDSANRTVFPEGFTSRGVRSTWHYVARRIEDVLIPIVREAEKRDARNASTKTLPSDNIMHAARALLDFWRNGLGRTGGGRGTRAQRFIVDCLEHIEPDINTDALRRLR